MVGKTAISLAAVKHSNLPYVKISLFDQRIYSQMGSNKFSQFMASLTQSQPCVVLIENIDSFFDNEKTSKEGSKLIMH
jgi:hypothetical protein